MEQINDFRWCDKQNIKLLKKENKKLKELPSKIIEKVKEYFEVPEDMSLIAEFCEDDITISEEDFMFYLDSILEDLDI